jgi:hypothetical protein
VILLAQTIYQEVLPWQTSRAGSSVASRHQTVPRPSSDPNRRANRCSSEKAAAIVRKNRCIMISGQQSNATMDKFWSVVSMPLGVLLCFGPAIVVWLIDQRRNPPSKKPEDRE